MGVNSFYLDGKILDGIYKSLNLKKINLSYNRAKIRNNPTDFKLGSRVIINKEFENNSSYSRRITMLSHIISKTPFNFTTIGIPGPIPAVNVDAIKEKMISGYENGICDYTPSCFSKDENLRVYLDALLAYVLNYAEISKSKYTFKDFCSEDTIKRIEFLIDKYIGVMDFLTTEKSIATELFLSSFNFKNKSFEDLRELKDSQEIIESGKGSLPILAQTESFVWCPISKLGTVTLANPTGRNNVELTDLTIPDAETVLDSEIRRAYALGIEVMYYLYNYQNDIFEIFFDTSSDTFKKLVVDATSAGIFFENNPVDRFNGILNLIYSFSFPSIRTVYTKNDYYVPMLLHNLIEFAQNFAYMNYQIKLSLLLINYCNENDIEIRDTIKSSGSFSSGKDDEDEDDEDEDEDGDEEYEEDCSDGDGYTSVDYEDISKPSSKKSKRSHKTKASEVDPAILDKAATSFKSSLYNFDVESKYTSSPTKAEISEYNAIADASKMITTLLIKEIKNIKCYNFGGKNSGKNNGKLDNKRLYLYKTQKNIFYDNTYKTKEMDPVFGIVLDQSGSMDGRGIRDGKITMILLHEVLKSLGVNHSIIGHTSDGQHHSKIFKYVAFKEDKGYTLNKAYNLVNLEAYYGNCDSGALYYMEQQLLRTKQKDKICMIFSDGSPTECTRAELIEQVNKMEREGIRVIGIGINFESIKNYYPNNANGKNLKEMLDIVCNLLKQFVLEKED